MKVGVKTLCDCKSPLPGFFTHCKEVLHIFGPMFIGVLEGKREMAFIYAWF